MLKSEAIAADITRMPYRAPYRARWPFALALALLAFSVVVAPAVSSPARAHARMGGLEAAVLVKLNKVRARHGLRPLRFNVELADAAAQHSVEMGSDGYFQHSSVDGTPFWKRISRFYKGAGRGYWSVGENLLWSTGSPDPGEAVAEWMASPPHRANILSRRWHEIGVAAARFEAAGGVYDGRSVMILTTDFGVRH